MKKFNEPFHTISGHQVKSNTSLGTRSYTKEINSNQSRGPGTVIDQVSQQALLKHGCTFASTHAECCKYKQPYEQDFPSNQNKGTDQTENSTLHEIHRSSTPENADYSSSSEDWPQPQTEMLKTVMHSTAHKNTTTDNKTTYSHICSIQPLIVHTL